MRGLNFSLVCHLDWTIIIDEKKLSQWQWQRVAVTSWTGENKINYSVGKLPTVTVSRLRLQGMSDCSIATFLGQLPYFNRRMLSKLN